MSTLNAVRQLIRQGYRACPEDLADMAMQTAPLLDATALVVYVVDHQQCELRPMIGDSTPTSHIALIDGTLADRAFSTISPVRNPQADGETVWVPLLDGSERMGVLKIIADQPLSDQQVADCAMIGTLFGELVVTPSTATPPTSPCSTPSATAPPAACAPSSSPASLSLTAAPAASA